MLNLDGVRLPKRLIGLWLIRSVVLTTVLAIIAVGVTKLIFYRNDWLLILALYLLIIGLSYMMMVYQYHFYTYELNEKSLSIQKGLFFRSTKTIPMNRIQNVDMKQGPIERFFNLTTIRIETAAHGFAINGLEPKVADTLRVQMIAIARQAKESNHDDQ